MKYLIFLTSTLFFFVQLKSQDSTVLIAEQRFTLSEVVVRNNLDYKRLLAQIKEDTTFYKAFRNLRILGFSAYNVQAEYDNFKVTTLVPQTLQPQTLVEDFDDLNIYDSDPEGL